MLELMARKKPITANDVADWFINRVNRQEGEIITTDEVLLVVYFAQAWHLANTGRVLFKDGIEAWALGPTVVSVFDRFENLHAASLPEIENAREVTGQKLELLVEVERAYGGFKARKLRELATAEGGPWAKARRGLSSEAASDRIIEPETMKIHYGEKIQQSR